jgi:hypothetical protein
MKLHVLVWAAATIGFASVSIAQSERSEPEPKSEATPVLVQEGRTRAPDRLTRSQDAQAIQEIARLTIEASLAFDRGDDELGRTRARAAAERLKIVEDRLAGSAHARARSKLAEQRGRLHLEFLGDEDAASEAFQDSVVAEANPVAERLLVELIERKERRTGSRTGEPGN